MEYRKLKESLSEELISAGVAQDEARRAAEIVVDNGWRVVKRGEWTEDKHYKGITKTIFVCSNCGRWQSSKKRSDKIFYMRYCPHCGARMTVSEDT